MKSNLIVQMFAFLLLGFLLACSDDEGPTTVDPKTVDPKEDTTIISTDKLETIRFVSNGKNWEAKIWIPAEYETNKDLPSIYLVDDEEQHYPVATDEFEQVIAGCKQISGLDVLVITVADLDPNMNVVSDFQEFYDIYNDLISYVETSYTTNDSRTLIGRGSAASMVLATLFMEEQETTVFQNFIATAVPGLGYFNEIVVKGDFPQAKANKKLHFSLDGESNYELNMKFINTLNEKAYPWLEFGWSEYPDLHFTNSYPTAYADGIKFIFEE